MYLLEVVAAFCVGGVLAFGMNGIALFRFRSAETAHWTERARRLYPLRRSASFNILLIPTIYCMIRLASLHRWDGFWRMAPVWAAAFLGALAGTYPFDKKIFPRLRFTGWLRLVYGTWLLRFGMIGIIFLGMGIMPDHFGWPVAVIACAIFAFQLGMNFGIWILLARACDLLKRAEDGHPLSAIVRQTSEKMQVPYRVVWILRHPLGYAAALPTMRDLIFSEGLIDSHLPEEIAAICAHELAHLSEPRRTVYARVMGAMTLYPLIFLQPMIRALDFAGLVILLIPIAFTIVFVQRLGRRMEVRADAIADKNATQAGVYATALERLYQTNQMPAVMRGNRQTHPHLYDRLVSAGVTPDYPRPKPPASLYWTTGFMYLVFVVLLILLSLG